MLRDDQVRYLVDASLATAGLVMLSPILLVVAVAITLDSPGAPWFLQRRVGRHGQPFPIVKFRTMHRNAEAVGGPLTVADDRRVTRVGRFLRASKIDELPQLINVVRGDMALVGPRPEVPRYVELYDEQQRKVLEVRPGITDPASLRYRNESALLDTARDPDELYRTQLLPHKLALNLAYLERRTLWSDVGVVLGTVQRVWLRPNGTTATEAVPDHSTSLHRS